MCRTLRLKVLRMEWYVIQSMTPIIKVDGNAMPVYENEYANFEDNVPSKDLEWCIVSCDIVPDMCNCIVFVVCSRVSCPGLRFEVIV